MVKYKLSIQIINMRAALVLIVLSLVVLSSGCTKTVEEVTIKFSDDNVTINLSGTNITLNESGIQDIIDALPDTENETGPNGDDGDADHDPCADKICDDSVTTCPDGTVDTCGNFCDQETGLCSSCIPDCAGHEEDACDLECGICQTLDEDTCECVTEFYCEGNGICTSDEWPDGEDCLKFGGCDDSDNCTTDTFDPNIQECVHVEVCCDDGDDCTLDDYNHALGECEFTYDCCGNDFCDEPGDLVHCPEECEFNGNVSDVFISGLDPEGNETVFLEGFGVDLTDWTIEDESINTYTFPDGFVIQEIAYLHTVGCVSDNNRTTGDLYWGTKSGDCRTGTIWNNDHDTATLRDASGEIVDEYSY